MTTDEVKLRREKAAENGETFLQPPPRLRGQSTYLALLSSLATDLDIMLNDLRSSPSTRLLPSNTHLQQRSSTTHSASPLTIGEHTAPTGYLHSPIRNSNHHQLNFAAQHPQKHQHSGQYCYNHQQQQYPYSLSKTCNDNQNSTPNSLNCNQQQQRLNQDSCKVRVRHINLAQNSGANDGVATGNAPKSPSSLLGLSPDVREIQKLPLWSYQHKQLRQPQKLHVQLLQQQRATKAIASQIAANSTDATVVSRKSPAVKDEVASDATTTSTTTTTSIMRNSCDIRCVRNGKYSSNVSGSSNWLQSSSSSASSSTATSASFFG